jgi:hypothetical protein
MDKKETIDIAISLCQEDLAYAKELRHEFNPKLNVYLYEERQDQLVAKDGLVEFGKKFQNEARIVVVLYRSRWGETLYTGIEQQGILDRIHESKEGPNFIVMIPMEGKEAPYWYPRSRIYADPERFSPEQIARWIEFKFQEQDGVVEPLTLEDKIAHFKEKEQQRLDHIKYLQSNESGPTALKVVEDLVKKVNGQIDLLQDTELNCFKEQHGFNEASTHRGLPEAAKMELEDHIIEFEIRPTNVLNLRETAQAHILTINCYEAKSKSSQKNWQLINSREYRVNTDGHHLQGWSEVVKPHNQNNLGAHKRRFYFQVEEVYDLGPIIPTAELVEKQFIWLFEQMEKGYKKLLNL